MKEEAISRSDLADAFRAAPLTDHGWDQALRLLASATGSSRAQLLALSERHLRFNWVTDVSENYYDDFLAIEGFRPDVNYRIAAMARPFELVWEDHYDAVQAHGANEAYLDHVRRFDAEHGAQIVLADQPGTFFGLAALHGANDGRTTAKQRRALADAAPHVLHAIRLQNALEHQGVELLRGSLEAMRVAAILLDGLGRPCAHTPGAEVILQHGAISIARGQLHAVHPMLDRGLQARIAAALTDRGQVFPDLWLQAGDCPVLVEANALPRRPWTFGFEPAVVVTFRSPPVATAVDAVRLADALGLTRAEGEIVAALTAGQSRQMIAAARGTSVQTVSTQLRAVFQKCAVHREAELVSIARAITALGQG